ncbi:MAG TPA: hypothetical protein VFQ06_04010 [Nitrospira sp.]|nr:hypothetical protein [Nitrospira sp.]
MPPDLFGLPSGFVIQGGAVGLLAFVLMFVFQKIVGGSLIPAKSLDRELAAANKRADEWKGAWEAEVQRGEVRDQQFGELLSSARTTDQLLRSLQALLRENRP